MAVERRTEKNREIRIVANRYLGSATSASRWFSIFFSTRLTRPQRVLPANEGKTIDERFNGRLRLAIIAGHFTPSAAVHYSPIPNAAASVLCPQGASRSRPSAPTLLPFIRDRGKAASWRQPAKAALSGANPSIELPSWLWQ